VEQKKIKNVDKIEVILKANGMIFSLQFIIRSTTDGLLQLARLRRYKFLN